MVDFEGKLDDWLLKGAEESVDDKENEGYEGHDEPKEPVDDDYFNSLIPEEPKLVHFKVYIRSSLEELRMLEEFDELVYHFLDSYKDVMHIEDTDEVDKNGFAVKDITFEGQSYENDMHLEVIRLRNYHIDIHDEYSE